MCPLLWFLSISMFLYSTRNSLAYLLPLSQNESVCYIFFLFFLEAGRWYESGEFRQISLQVLTQLSFSVTLHLFANCQATLVSILDVYENEKELWVTFFRANTTELKCPVEYSFLKQQGTTTDSQGGKKYRFQTTAGVQLPVIQKY